MDFPKYCGDIHPDEWINDLTTKLEYKGIDNFDFIKALVDTTVINISDEIYPDFEELRKALKEDVSFTVFKNTNKRMLQVLKYVPERKGGKTSEFISKFRKLCYNAEINDVEEQKKYLFKSISDDHYIYFLTEFNKKMKNVNSMNKLIETFEEIIMDESNLINNESIVTLKHVATGKYLSSIENLCYATGSKGQLVCFMFFFILK